MDELIKTLTARGLYQDATSGLEQRLRQGPITGYVGFDPTADSLHVGNLVPVMGAAWLQRFGHTPIILIGAGTGMVGDPSGKRDERPILSVSEIDRNASSIQQQLTRFVDFSSANAARLRNNADWLRTLPLMEFLRDTGKHLTLGFMLQKESVRSRPEGGINITAGIELIGKRERRQAYGLVFPLVTNASGTKFGKSEAGNVWLDPGRTSPYEFYQFWINVDDRDVERYLKLFTFLSMEEIGVALEQQAEDPGKRVAQRLLARDVTLRVHGPKATEEAIRTSETLFGGKTGSGMPAEMPTREISRAALGGRLAVVDLLVSSGLASSKADARRGIQGRGFYLNDAPIDAPDLQLSEDQLQGPPDRQFIILRKEKKNYVKLLMLP